MNRWYDTFFKVTLTVELISWSFTNLSEIRVCTYMYNCIWVYVYIHIYVYRHMYIGVYIYIFICVCMYIYLNMYIGENIFDLNLKSMKNLRFNLRRPEEISLFQSSGCHVNTKKICILFFVLKIFFSWKSWPSWSPFVFHWIRTSRSRM